MLAAHKWKGVHMIYVNQKQLSQVEYLIEQSARGHHVLFDIDIIRDAFNAAEADQEDNEESDEAIEKHIETLILRPTLLAKRTYLENLDPRIFRRVVRTYFSIVENNIFETNKFDN